MTRRIAPMVLVTTVLVTGMAHAAPTNREQCATAAEEAQRLRDEGKYRLTREQLNVCVRNVCPAVIRNDCVKWLGDLERDAPSMVFGARDKAGNDLFDVKVSMDGVPIQERLDGKPVLVDTGEHVVKFEGPGVVKEQRVLIKTGERSRPLTVTLDPTATDTKAPEAKERDRRSLVPPLVLGGVGVLALGSFAFFGLSGRGDIEDLRRTCSPDCAQSDVDDAKRKLLIADISLGVGVVAIGVATYMLLTRTQVEAPRAQANVRFDFRPITTGGYAGMSGSF